MDWIRKYFWADSDPAMFLNADPALNFFVLNLLFEKFSLVEKKDNSKENAAPVVESNK